MYVVDYAGDPNKLLSALAELAARSGNERLRRVWAANLERSGRKNMCPQIHSAY